MSLVFVPQPSTGAPRLGDFLLQELENERWSQFRAAVAFARFSGVQHLSAALGQFCKRGQLKVSVGLDLGGTSAEALNELLACTAGTGEIYVFHNRGKSTFHPKVYFFRNEASALLIVGSGNLTEGGLYTNYEASMGVHLALGDPGDLSTLQSVESTLDSWSNGTGGVSQLLTAPLLKDLVDSGAVVSESKLAAATGAQQKAIKSGKSKAASTSPFSSLPVPKAPTPGATVTRPALVTDTHEVVEDVETEGGETEAGVRNRTFLMILQRTDVGVGQTHSGTSRRSPEVFIPLAARDRDPDFWEWPNSFYEDPTKTNKFDRKGVVFRIGTSVFEVNMMTWPDKSDFRLRSEALRSAGDVGDILRIEKAELGKGVDYYAEVIPQGTSEFATYEARCTEAARPPSKKRWGYY